MATVEDLVEATGLGRDMVKAGIVTGQLPGYRVQAEGSTRGRYVIPDEAFARFKRGEWVPQPRSLQVEPIRVLPSYLLAKGAD